MNLGVLQFFCLRILDRFIVSMATYKMVLQSYLLNFYCVSKARSVKIEMVTFMKRSFLPKTNAIISMILKIIALLFERNDVFIKPFLFLLTSTYAIEIE